MIARMAPADGAGGAGSAMAGSCGDDIRHHSRIFGISQVIRHGFDSADIALAPLVDCMPPGRRE
jgi:hypothetical protein